MYLYPWVGGGGFSFYGEGELSGKGKELTNLGVTLCLFIVMFTGVFVFFFLVLLLWESSNSMPMYY